MQIQQKADYWLVHDDSGMHRFDTEDEALEYTGQKPEKKDTVSIDDKDLFSADA